MTPRWRRVLYLGGLGVGGLLFLNQTWNGYQAVAHHALDIVSPGLLGIAWALIALAFGLQIGAWSILMRGLGCLLPWRHVVSGYTLSFLPRYIPGSVWGYVSRSEWLYQGYHVPYRLSNLGSALEIAGIVASNSLILAFSYAWSFPALVRLAVILALPLVLMAIRPIMGRLSRRSAACSLPLKEISAIPLASWLLILALYLLLWLSHGIALWLLILAFHLPGQGPAQTTASYALAWLVGFIVPFAPAGLGVRELTLSTLLAGNAGLLGNQASALAVIVRFGSSLAELLWVLIGVIVRQGDQSRGISARYGER